MFSQQLDREKPLWEIWLVDELADGRFALICKTHHALVDGISGVDILTVLFDITPDAPEPEPGPPWAPQPLPSGAELLAHALAERATAPVGLVRSVLAHPDRAGADAGRSVAGLAAMAAAGIAGAPPSPLNVRIGPHRRFAWVDGGAGAVQGDQGRARRDDQRRRPDRRRRRVAGAFVPARARPRRARAQGDGADLGARGRGAGALGNQVAAMYAPLPVGLEDPIERYRSVHGAMKGLKESGQAVGAQAITRLADAAAPTVLNQAGRLQSRQRFFNLTVTNVPGPQLPLYVMGRRLEAFYPKVPLVLNTALGIAIMSYDGQISFGLLGDYDALADIDELAADLDARDRGTGRGRRRRAGRQATAARAVARVKRVLIVLAVVVVAAAGCIALITVLVAQDSSEVDGSSGPGVLEPDRGARRLGDDAPADARLSRRPTRRRAGRTAPSRSRRDATELSEDQLLEALALGNVVIAYDTADPPAELLALQRDVSGPFDPGLAAAGQAVILARRPGVPGVVGAGVAAQARSVRAGRPAAARVRRGLPRPGRLE